MSLPAQGTVISRLRLRGVSGDSLAMRQRLSSVLSAADLEPAGLPATAIVVIRSLRDPQPGRLRLMQVGQPPPLAWQQAVGQSIDALARRAARPACGFVADSAEAVLFMDRSELLACLARDWCSAAIATRWWWRSLLRDPDIARAVLGEWLQSLEYAPAALQLLADSRHATAFVRRLVPASVNALLVGLLDRFGLAGLHGSIVEVAQRFAASPAEREWHEPSGDVLVGTATIALPSPADPFMRWVPQVREPGLVPGQRLLLGIGLMLRRAPAVVRSQEFALHVARWAAALSGKSGASKTVAAPNRVIGRPATNHESVYRGEELVRAEPRRAPIHNAQSAAPFALTTSARQPEPTPVDSAAPADQVPLPIEPMATRFPERQAASEPVSSPDERWIDSAHGGALFLVNLGLFLELYANFSQPTQRGLALSIWDFVALVGESLVGHSLRDDPLWPLLAELAGRQPGEEPGLHYQPPADWRMPLSWLKPFAAGNHWEWSGRQSRLQIRHPAGFVVVDVAIPERNPTYRLDAELAPYRAAGLCTSAARRAPLARAGMWNNSLSLRERVGVRDIARTCAYPEVSPHPDLLPEGEGTGPFQHSVTRPTIRRPALRRWCGWLLPYVQSRLAAALGVNTGEVGKLLCACPARLRVTATHLDAHFALANLPINVRLAGLDRDPGWLPAAGRYIKFHFD